MSDWPVPPEQPEGIHWRVIFISIAVTLFIFGMSVMAVAFVQTTQRGVITPEMGRPEINELFTTPFPIETAAMQQREHERARLEGWGWVSRQNNEIHMPVEEAITDVLREHARPNTAGGATR